MTENLKVFLEQMKQNPSLKDELDALGRAYPDKEQLERNRIVIAQKTVEIAAKHGFTLTKEDMETETVELTENQLKTVAGGVGQCFCPVVGNGGDFKYGGDCGCVALGKGKSRDGVARCVCEAGGMGWD